jgi:predicted CXXCH cytochrome family protein
MSPAARIAMVWCRYLLYLFWSVAAFAQTISPGASPCAQCHSQAKTQPSTSMGHALETVEGCKTLIDHPLLTVTVGKYSYRIERKGVQSDYSVSDGTKTLTLPIRWIMGASSAIGQTFILTKDGELYESRVSYFRDVQGLGPTLGSEGSIPGNISEAAGRLMTQEDKLSCFGCHATNARSGNQLTLDKMSPGVQCAHCHKDTDTHLAAMLLNSNDLESHKEKGKPHEFAAEQVSDFCGQCHRTWAEIAMQSNPGIANIRFQPYRLAGSKCYDVDDARISCLACHDPHHEVNANLLDYDAKCLACHGGRKPGAKNCPKSKQNCVTCHMPKLELPGAHFKFSDHRIRIVKPNEPFPG